MTTSSGPNAATITKLFEDGIKANNEARNDDDRRKALRLWEQAQALDPKRTDIKEHIVNVRKQIELNAYAERELRAADKVRRGR